MVPRKYSTETSNASPFSATSGLETTPRRTSRKKSVSLSAPSSSSVVQEESVYTEITDLTKRSNNSIVSAITSARTSLRVRVINQVSELCKDILVEIRNDLNLFDAIYDKQAVKKANIRKWGSAVTKQVKSGSHEIRCSIWDDEVNSPCHTYSIEEMKQTTTRQLYHLVGPEIDLIKLKLQCMEKKTDDTRPTSTVTQTIHSQSQEILTCASDSLCDSSNDDLKAPAALPLERGVSEGNRTLSQKRRSDSRSHRRTISSNGSGSFRCSVDDAVFRQFRERDRDSTCTSRHSTYSNHANDTVSTLDDNDTSTIRTTKSLGQSTLEPKSTMRVKISNESSKRHKDLVVDIKDNLYVHESIYDHKSVKSAQVRKWTSDVVKDVKKKVKEVHCVVLDGSAEQNVYATYSVDDLKRLSTKDLFDLVPKSDPVQLVLRCVDTNVNGRLNNQHSNNRQLKDPFRIVQKQDQSSISGSSKRSSRINHMNLSALTFNGSCSSFGESNGSRNYSHVGTNASFISDDKKPSCLRARSNSMNQKFFSEQISKKDNLFSLEHLDTEYEDLKSANAKQSASPLLENNDQPCSDCATRDSIERSQQNALQAAPMNVSSVFDEEKLSEFKKLCRNKKGREFQSGGNLNKLVMPGDSRNTSDKSSASDIRNASSKTAESEIINDSYKAPVSGFRNASFKIPVSGVRNATFKSPASDIRNTSFKTSPSGLRSASFKTPVSDQRDNSFKSSATDTLKQSPRTGSDKIRRFLEFSAKREVSFEGSGDNSVPMTTLDTDTSQKSTGSFMANVPPIAEIEVVKGHPTEVHVSVDQPSIPLSGDLVKQVFPYHIVINENFRIIQIGNSLARLIENEFLIGKCVSDVLTITGPIPSFGKRWDWRILDKMKEKTIFFEALCSNSSFQKPKIKGSMIELKKAPNRQVLLALSPNVKNLSELETMNLSMTDLPLHSCQRDAVLLGEHSKSEVKLTNHLDHLHRDLIDSMEKQIEDRTNELGTANTNLELANAQLAVQSAKQLEHFACMSHEIRTPLNCIVGMSSLLLEESEGPSMDPMQADSIRMINTSGELLRAVVDDVLDYAKLESGSFEVDMKSTKLQDTLDSVLYSISQKMQDKNVRLRTHFTPTVPEYIETDSRRLQQVLFNLLGNAGKFSKTNSVIDLSVSLIKASSQSYSNESSESQDLIRFSVRDYGKGIEKKDFETIFQPFSQASKETQNIYGGTGLGLSITSKLVHRLGGTISLDSELGKFADFTVDLPMNGKYIEVKKISDSLKNATLVFIEPKQMNENTFSSSPFKTEPVALDSDVVDIFGLNVIRCHSMDELNDKISAEKNRGTQQHFNLLVHETLHEFCSLAKLDFIFGHSRYSLMTYGANFLVEKTRASHFKSLTALFPATLLESIAKQSSEQELLKTKASSLPPNNSLVSSLATRIPMSPNTAKKVMGSAAPGGPNLKRASTPSKTPSSSLNSRMTQNDFRKEMKVLYAEDNLVNQKVLSRVLNRSGITDITIVDNGKKAVDISATVKYDCILLDMQMPVMDGMEACEIIMERDPETIIIFVTAHALDEFKVKAKAAGAKGFISKPFRVGDIDDVLKEIYGK